MKYTGTPVDCKSPKTPMSGMILTNPAFLEQFTFETHLKEVAMTDGMHPERSEHHTSSSAYIDIPFPNGGFPNGRVINTSSTNGYINPNAGRHLNRSNSEGMVSSTRDHQCVSKCTLYILKCMTVVSLLMATVSLVFMQMLWNECNQLKNRLSTAEVSYTAGLTDPQVCLPCDDLSQGPFDEDNVVLKTLIQRKDNHSMTCCAKSSAQISTLLNLFVKRKQAEKCNLEYLNNTVSTGCQQNATTSPGAPPTPSTSRPSAHLQIHPNRKQTESGEDDPIRHWTHEGKVTHLDGIVMIDDRLRIPETGTYFLYSQVGFLVFYDVGTTKQNIDLASQALFHKMYRYNPIYPNKGSQELLRSEVTQCWEQNKRYGRYTSYVGAALKLNRGDEVYVKVSRISTLSPEDSLTYFGLFKINS